MHQCAVEAVVGNGRSRGLWLDGRPGRWSAPAWFVCSWLACVGGARLVYVAGLAWVWLAARASLDAWLVWLGLIGWAWLGLAGLPGLAGLGLAGCPGDARRLAGLAGLDWLGLAVLGLAWPLYTSPSLGD